MKQKTETVLTAFTAHVQTSLSSIPDNDPCDWTDEQIEAIANRETEAGTVSPMYRAACDLLDAIHDEEPYFQQVAEENRIAARDEADEQKDKGLTTEINRSVTLVSLSDTVGGCADILKRHQFGYKNGSRDSKGRVSNKPFTAAENESAEKWLESIKTGTPLVVVETAD